MHVSKNIPIIRLKEFVNALGMTFSTFARSIGLSEQGLSPYIYGARTIGRQTYARLEKAGLSPQWLQYGTGPVFSDSQRGRELKAEYGDVKSIAELNRKREEEIVDVSEFDEYERLYMVAKRYFGGLGELARKMDKPRQTFYTYKGKQFGRRILDELKDSLQINPDFIKFGDKPMLLIDEESEDSSIQEYASGTSGDKKIAEPGVSATHGFHLPDIRTLTIDEMKQVLEWCKENIPKIERILEALDEK